MVYKTTHNMVSDYLTKPLVSNFFSKHRVVLLKLEKKDYNTFYVKYNNLEGDQSKG